MKRLSELHVGAKVKDPQTRYNNQPIMWVIAAKNHNGYPADSVTLMAEKILTIKAFDAKETSSGDTGRQQNGNNNYKVSNINKWLNSVGTSWYIAQHTVDAPPNRSNVRYNAYDIESGFLSGFHEKFRSALKDTTLRSIKPKVDGAGYEDTTVKVFLISATEIGKGSLEGRKLEIFYDESNLDAYPTAEAVNKSEYKDSIFLNTKRNGYWYLRTAGTSNAHNVQTVLSSGRLDSKEANSGMYGIRPFCNVKSDILVSDSPGTDGAYTIEWNQAPTNPSSITVPSNIKANSSAYIYWGTSTDPEETSVGYELERRIDSGPWTRIYRGITKNYTDTIGTGWSTVTYRVRAYDIENKYSGYTTSPTRNVINNTLPSIASQQQENIGLKTQEFSISYTITDPDLNQTLTVREYIDKKEKRSYTASSGKSYTFQVTREEWIEILNGTHTLKITVSDSAGGYTEKVFTFSKNETEIAFQLKNPLPADDQITKATANIVGVIPEAAILRVEVCNNAFDSAPTWEDVTQQVKQNAKFFLTNKTKTDKRWGFNIRVRVQRNQTYGECYISSIGGNFE